MGIIDNVNDMLRENKPIKISTRISNNMLNAVKKDKHVASWLRKRKKALVDTSESDIFRFFVGIKLSEEQPNMLKHELIQKEEVA